MTFSVEKLAAFACDCHGARLAEPVRRAAELAVLDTVAAALGGARTRNAVAARLAARDTFGEGGAEVWFAQETMHKPGAIFANCAAASALDVDDGHRGAAGHPGAAIVPAILGEAPHCGADGRDVLAAVAVGYDVALRVASARRRETRMSYASGRWTGYGVAAAVGVLRRLPVDVIAHAIAIAGAEAPQNLPQGDSRTVSSVKGSSPWSTVTAIAAVDRASRGGTGPVDLLDREQVYDVPTITADLGVRWLINETYLKPYASCRYTHPVLDAVFMLVSDHGVNVSAIKRLIVEIFPEARKIANEVAPLTLEGAQFSLPFTAALAVLRGRSAFRPMLEESLADGEVLALARRVELVFSEEFAGAFPQQTPARVSIVTAERTFTRTVLHPWGDVDNPMQTSAVEEKLRDLGAGLIDDDTANGLIAAVAELGEGNAHPLLQALAQPTAPHRGGVCAPTVRTSAVT